MPHDNLNQHPLKQEYHKKLQILTDGFLCTMRDLHAEGQQGFCRHKAKFNAAPCPPSIGIDGEKDPSRKEIHLNPTPGLQHP